MLTTVEIEAVSSTTAISVDPMTTVVGNNVEIRCSGIPAGTTQNWIAVVPPDGFWSSGMPYSYLPENVTETAMLVKPSKVGESEVVMYINNLADPASVVARSGLITVGPRPNAAPIWDIELPPFLDGKPGVIRLRNHVYDENVETLLIALRASSGDLAASGIVYDEATDELRYDGRSLQVEPGVTHKVGEITVEAAEPA